MCVVMMIAAHGPEQKYFYPKIRFYHDFTFPIKPDHARKFRSQLTLETQCPMCPMVDAALHEQSVFFYFRVLEVCHSFEIGYEIFFTTIQDSKGLMPCSCQVRGKLAFVLNVRNFPFSVSYVSYVG